jgi:Tol biopolymer transport system component
LRRLTAVRNAEDVDPVWSPEGGRIAFGRYSRGWRLYTMDAAGGHVRAITAVLSLGRAPTWSPDGRRLAFEWMPLHPPSNYAQQVAVVNADGSGLRILTSYARFRGGTGHPSWSPNGRTILFSARSSSMEGARTDVWSVRADGRGARRLLANAADAAWSPDGHRIAFSRRGDLYTVTSAGAAPRRLTRGHYADSIEPSWSPDGRQIAFSIAFYDKSKQQTSQSIMVVNADGTNRREITKRDPDFWATSPAWQPAAERAR